MGTGEGGAMGALPGTETYRLAVIVIAAVAVALALPRQSVPGLRRLPWWTELLAWLLLLVGCLTILLRLPPRAAFTAQAAAAGVFILGEEAAGAAASSAERWLTAHPAELLVATVGLAPALAIVAGRAWARRRRREPVPRLRDWWPVPATPLTVLPGKQDALARLDSPARPSSSSGHPLRRRSPTGRQDLRRLVEELAAENRALHERLQAEAGERQLRRLEQRVNAALHPVRRKPRKRATSRRRPAPQSRKGAA